jgi:hypothetical protein
LPSVNHPNGGLIVEPTVKYVKSKHVRGAFFFRRLSAATEWRFMVQSSPAQQ